jgi:hypothetical protein
MAAIRNLHYYSLCLDTLVRLEFDGARLMVLALSLKIFEEYWSGA